MNREWNILDVVDTVIKSELMFEDGRIMKTPLLEIGKVTPRRIFEKYGEETRDTLINKGSHLPVST